MSKIISILISLLILNTSCIKNPWECANENNIVKTCPTTHTCCQNAFTNEYKCHEVDEGTCCENGTFACARGTLCNLKEKSCESISLKFLAYLEEKQIKKSVEPEDVQKLFKGFVEGLVIFNNLPHADSCSSKDFDVISDDFEAIINILKELKWDDHLVDQLTKILDKVRALYEDSSKIVGPCAQLAEDVRRVLTDVLIYCANPLYYAQLPFHIFTDLANLQQKAKDANELYDNGDFEGAGKGYGDLLHEALLWDYKPTPQ
jgi:hypothetical protein